MAVITELMDIREELSKVENTHNLDIRSLTFEDFATSLTGEDRGRQADYNKFIETEANVVIFINQGFVGMNKWLISKYKEITNSDMVILDTDINYNKYIDKGYKVVPIGEDAIINQVLEDFYG